MRPADRMGGSRPDAGRGLGRDAGVTGRGGRQGRQPGPFNARSPAASCGSSRTFAFDPNNPITLTGTIDSNGNVNIPDLGADVPRIPIRRRLDLTVRINPAAPITGRSTR